MDTFRLTLIFLGLAVLFIIYLLETQRRRKLKQGQRDRQQEPSLSGSDGDQPDDGDGMPDDVPDMPANLNIDDFRAQPSALNGGAGVAADTEDMVAGSPIGTPIGAGILGRETLGAPRYSPPDPAAGDHLDGPLPGAGLAPPVAAAPDPALAPAIPGADPFSADAAAPAITTPTPDAGALQPPVPPPIPPMAQETPIQEADEVPEPPEGMPELIIALQLTAPDEGQFNGRELQEALRHCDLEYGPMQIYHYYTPRRRTLFYLANAMEPGSFDLTSMASLNTPRVLFFLRLPTVIAGREAFDIMLDTARKVCDRLNGILQDQQGASLGKHELILIRERIAEYEYKSRQRRREMEAL